MKNVRLILRLALLLTLAADLILSLMALAEYLGGVAEYRDWLWFCR